MRHLLFDFPEGIPSLGRIRDEEGNDITDKLHVTEAVIYLRPGDVIRAELKCALVGLNVKAQVEDDDPPLHTTCLACGGQTDLVRPGKYQCVNCEDHRGD